MESNNHEAYQRYRGIERHVQTLRSQEGGAGVDELDALLLERDQIAGETPEAKEDTLPTKELMREARELSQQLGGDEEVRRLGGEAFGLMMKFYRKQRGLDRIRAKLAERVETLIRQTHANASESAAAWRTVSRYEGEIKKTKEAIERIAHEDPIAFQTYWLLKLRDFKKQFAETGVIETDAIRERTDALMDDVRRKLEGTNGVAALFGPTGSGKTATARKIAAQLSPDGKYEFVASHPKMTADDLIDRMGIVVDSIPASEIPSAIKRVQDAYRAEHAGTLLENDGRELEMIRDVIIARESQKTLESKRVLEAVGRAAAEGRIVVIDEFNYLPADTLASLNDLISGKSKTRPGFGVIFTGNVGDQYLKRASLDPAFVNRILSGTVKYDFPPQELDASLADSVVSTEKRLAGDKPASRDLYQIALTQLLDKRGNLLAPEHALEEVWDFVRVTAMVQRVSEGKNFRDLALASGASAGVTKMQFEKVFLSFRNVNQIVREWKMDGFSRPIDWYVFQDVIRPATVIAPKEAAQLLYLFRDFGGMFQGSEYAGIEVDAATWRMEGVDAVRASAPKSIQLKGFLPSEVVVAVSGEELPPMETVVAAAARTETAEMEREIARMEQLVAEERALFEAEPDIEALCAVGGPLAEAA